VTFDGTGNTTVTGVVANGGTSTVSALTKAGTGTLTLTGTNTYGGATTINGGTLYANNTPGSGSSATGAGAVTVNSGGTLAGSGAVTGAVTINSGGTLAPGTSIESLDTGALSFASGSTFSVELNSSAPLSVAADLVNATGDLTIANNLANLSFIASGTAVLSGGTKFTLISYTGTWNGGIFLNRADDSLVTVGVNTYVINYNDTLRGSNFDGGPAGIKYLTLTAVPEASAFVFGGLICLIVGMAYGTRALLRLRAVAIEIPRS
jgi:autotransporter-associated beta strand protein